MGNFKTLTRSENNHLVFWGFKSLKEYKAWHLARPGYFVEVPPFAADSVKLDIAILKKLGVWEQIQKLIENYNSRQASGQGCLGKQRKGLIKTTDITDLTEGTDKSKIQGGMMAAKDMVEFLK